MPFESVMTKEELKLVLKVVDDPPPVVLPVEELDDPPPPQAVSIAATRGSRVKGRSVMFRFGMMCRDPKDND